MGLQSVLKIRGETSKLSAPQASPYKGSKPRVNLDPFVFSIRTAVPLFVYRVNIYEIDTCSSIIVITLHVLNLVLEYV
jgi:hypothetical protein